MSTPRNKEEYLGINPTKYFEDLYKESSKTLMKEIKDPNKWRTIACSQKRRQYC